VLLIALQKQEVYGIAYVTRWQLTGKTAPGLIETSFNFAGLCALASLRET